VEAQALVRDAHTRVLEPVGRIVHVDGVVVEADRGFAEMFGFADADEAIGTSLFELIAPNSAATIFLDCIRRDGRKILVESETTPIEFRGQHARAVTVRDASTRRKGDLALREANQRFRLAFDGAPIGMALVGTDGRWIQVNPALCEIVGYRAEELLAKTFQEITHPDDLDADLALMRRVLADEIADYSMEKRYFHADGHVVWINLSVSLVRDPSNKPLYFVSQIEDVTERKRVDEALVRESATVGLLERIAVAANEALSVDDAYGRALELVCAHTGWPVGHVYVSADDGTEDLVSSGIWHLDDVARFEPWRVVTEATRRAPGEGLPGRVLDSGRAVTRIDGNNVSPRATVGRKVGLRAGFAFPVLVGREVVAVFEFFSDAPVEPEAQLLEVVANVGTQLGRVVERERLRMRQQELDGARERFVANAAHELRTPLATMRAVGGLLGTRRAEMTPEEIDECFDMLERQGERLETLVRDLLDLSRIEHDDVQPDTQAVPVESWIVQTIEDAPPPDDVTVSLEWCPGLAVIGNPDRLSRVLVNLLTNAYRYGGDTIRVTARRRGSDAIIEVEDDGEGVPEHLVGQLFEPFTRGENSGEGGAGLGLAITQRIVEHLGGAITYEARDPVGARFLVRMPAAS
jgi:PAS domain S-box-containing protein